MKFKIFLSLCATVALYASLDETTLGAGTNATNYGTAIGYHAIATGQGSVAIGHETTSLGSGSLAIGTSADADGNSSIVVGNGSAASIGSKNAVVLGVLSQVGSQNGIAIGKGVALWSSASNSIGIGNDIILKGANSVSFLSGTTETRDNIFNVGNRRITNLLAPSDPTDAATKAYVDNAISSGNDLSNFYTKTQIDVSFANYYDKTASDARFASKSDTYTKAQVDSAIASGSTGSVDLSNYYDKSSIDTTIGTAKNDAINTAKTYSDTQDVATLNSAKAYVDGNFYNKTYIDSNYYTKTQTYNKSEVDALVSGVPSTDLSGVYTKTQIDASFVNYYDKTASDARFASKSDTYTKAQIYSKTEVDAIVTGVSTTDVSGFYTKTDVNTMFANYYDKTASDARFASKSDTYTKAQVDSAIASGSTGSVDLSNYYDKSSIDTTIGTAKNDAINTAKTYSDTQDVATLNSAKAYVDGNFYNKTYIDSNYYTKTQTYNKSEVDALVSGVPSTDLSGVYTKTQIDASFVNYYDKTASDARFASKSDTYTKAQIYSKTEVDAIVTGVSTTDVSGFYTKTDVNTMFANYYDKSAIDARFSNYLSTAAIQSLITTAKAETITATQTASGLAQANAVSLSKTYTDSVIANLSTTTAGTADKTYVDTSVATAQTSAIADANTYTDAKTTSTLSDAKAYTDTQVTAMGAKITKEQADALSASTESVALTKTSSITGNVHGITIYDDKTTISGGTTSTQMTLNDDTVDFKHIQTGDAVRLTGIAEGINDTDAANVRQVNTAKAEAIASSNAYTDQEVSVAKKEAAQGTALAIALATPMSFQNGNNAMNIGTGYYKGEKAISVKLGKKVDDSIYYTVGVATAGKDAVAAQASVGWSW